MNAPFDDWAACQRLFNVTPQHVEVLSAGPVKVRFLAQLSECSDSPRGIYDDEKVLAGGLSSDDDAVELSLVRDEYRGEPCYLLIRTAPSFFGDDASYALEVHVYDGAQLEAGLVDLLRKSCSEDSFEDLTVEEPSATKDPVNSAVQHSRPPQSFSEWLESLPWWKKLFSR